MSRTGRQAAWRRGRGGEGLAALWLRLKGYRILARGFRCPLGEVDIIARRGRTLALVEVKARPRLESARDAIRPRQRRRIAGAAEVYLQRHPELGGCELRFDAVFLAPWRWPQHVTDAWRSDDAGL